MEKPDEWMRDTLSLIHTSLTQHSEDIKELGIKKVSNTVFYWIIGGFFLIATSVFGMELANIIISAKTSSRMNTRLVETLARVNNCCQKVELQLDSLKELHNKEMFEIKKQLDGHTIRLRTLEEKRRSNTRNSK